VPQIEVTFDIDANGIVNVSARDKATGREQKITITASSGLNEEDIKRMVDDAKRHESEDKERRERVEQRNSLEAMVIQTEKLLSEAGDKIPAGPKAEVEAAVVEAKAALESEDADKVKAAKDKLTQASHKMAQAMYGQAAPGAPEQQPGAAPGGASGPGAAPEEPKAGEGDVIDAEFEEKN